MTDKAKIKKEVKIVLRALLLSAPLGLTAVEIERDFREAQGYGVPYRELGYNSTSDLVEDLPDIASCHWERGHAVFHGIADKTTKHIQSLVSRQKVDVSKCLKRRNALERQVVRPGRGGYSSGRGRSFSTSSGRSNVRSQAPYSRAPQGFGQGRRTNSYPGSSLGGRPKPSPLNGPKSSPAYLRMQMKSLLNSHPNGILNTHFDAIFSRKCGFTVDYSQLGFTDLEDLVKSLSDLISLERINEEKFRIYSRENFPKGTENSPKGASRTSNESYASKAKIKPLMSDGHGNIKPLITPKQPPPLLSPPIPDARKSMPFQAPQRGIGRARRISSNRSDESSTRVGSSGSSSVTSPRQPSPPGNDLIDKQLCSEIRQILEDYPNGLFAASLPTEYKALTKKELPLISIGFYSVVELVSAIPDIVAIERQKKNSDWILFDARTFVPSKPPEPEIKKKPKDSPPKELNNETVQVAKANIREVLLSHPTGILLQELSSAYEKFHRTSLPVEDFEVRDVNSLVLAIPDTIKVVYKGQNQVYLHAQDQRLPLTSGSLYSTIAKSIPQDAIGYGYSYPTLKKPKLNEYFPVYVSTVYTPHKLSIQVKDKESNLALENLMDGLESVYHFAEGEKYLMPDAMIAVNQICCSLYHEDNNWHRGIITGVPNLDLVEVYYVDYGTSLRIPKNSLRLLKSCFMKLPKQAIDAKLGGIEPVGDKWSEESRDRLLELSFNKPLQAYAMVEKTTAGVFDTDPFSESSVMSLILCDTSTSEDIHINDLLVSEGLACFAEQKGPAEPVAESPVIPPPAEVSLQMLTGMGLPVPDDDSALAFQWPEESAEVQRILGSGDAQTITRPQERSSGDGQVMVNGDVTNAGDGRAVIGVDNDSSDSGPPSLKEDDAIEKMARELSEIDEEGEDDMQKPWSITRVELVTGQTLHLISFKDQGGQFVTSVEVSALIWPTDPDENALFDMIELKAAQLGQVIVEELESSELADSFAREGVPLSKISPSKLQLFLLTSVAPLLMVSGQVSTALIGQIQALASDMPPLEDDDLSRESVSSETSASLDTEQEEADLKKMHDVLRTKRERILKDLMSNTGSVDVDEITYIEGLMKDIERKLEKTKSIDVDQGSASLSLGDISAQLAQTSIGSSMSPRTPDDVFSPPSSRHPSSVFSPDQSTKNTHSQTVGDLGQQRHYSDRAAASQKQTAAISPLQRSSTGTMPKPQRGIGRGVNMPTMNAGMGRGQQLKNGRGPPPLIPYSQAMKSLNPNTPAFVPSPKRDGSVDDNVKGQLQQPSPQGLFMDPFGNRQAPVPSRKSQIQQPKSQGLFMDPFTNHPAPVPTLKGQTQQQKPQGMFMDPFANRQAPVPSNAIPPLGQTIPEMDIFKPIPLLPPNIPLGMPPPPMPSRTGGMGMNQLPPPPLMRGIAMAPPPLQPIPNPMPGLPLPPNFDMMPSSGPLFDPNAPPFFGLGRGQAWSLND
ncbi:uncharacterized protein LOC129277426 isoform X1 [Lytechinus pictus]|uniref:uncharacterized protein LOC129277426 isoform X1 n=1 Tax=Lytechinus pictus TaxID=7653 RepID=UPI0030BA2158